MRRNVVRIVSPDDLYLIDANAFNYKFLRAHCGIQDNSDQNLR